MGGQPKHFPNPEVSPTGSRTCSFCSVVVYCCKPFAVKRLLPALLMIFVLACEKPGDEKPGNEEPNTPQNISANRSQIVLDYFHRYDTITVDAEGEWTVGCEPYSSEMDVRKIEGVPNKFVASSTSELTNGIDRTATVVVRPANSTDTASLYIPFVRLAIPKDTLVFGGESDDMFNDIVNAGVDRLLAVGYTEGADGVQHHGGKDFWIVKFTNDGKKEWSKAFGGSQDDVATSVVTSYKQEDMTSYFDGYIIGGYTFSNDGDVTGNHGQKDAWVIKIDTLGNLVWKKILGTAGDDEIVEMMNGSIPGPLVSGIKDNDQWIMKWDGNGDMEWEETFGSSGIDFAGGITETQDGYYFTGSGELQDGDVADKPTSSYDAWIVKISKEGEKQWVRYIGGAADEKGISIGGFYNMNTLLIGTTESNDIFPEFDGQRNIFAASYDRDGNLLWKKIIKHTKWDEPAVLGGTKFGNIIIAGRSKNPASPSNDENAFDASLVVITPTGDVLLSRMLGAPGPDGITGITSTGFSKTLVGYSSGGAANTDLDGYFGWFDYR